MTAKIILNPYANHWQAQKQRPNVEAALQKIGIDYEFAVSQHPGHGIELAQQAVAQGYDPVIAAGGDSTINEVVNGIIIGAGEQSNAVRFGVIPLGTANDLADNLGIPKNIEAACQLIQANQPRLIDVCQVNERYFINNSGLGLETTVTVIQMGLKRIHGVLRYIVAALMAVQKNPEWEMEIYWDDGAYTGPVKIVSVGNNPRTGGIFYTVPNANPFDGKLSFVYGYAKTRGEVLRLLPRIMKSGAENYTHHPHIHEVHCTWIKIQATPATPLHADGEVTAMAIHDLYYQIHPQKINILLP